MHIKLISNHVNVVQQMIFADGQGLIGTRKVFVYKAIEKHFISLGGTLLDDVDKDSLINNSPGVNPIAAIVGPVDCTLFCWNQSLVKPCGCRRKTVEVVLFRMVWPGGFNFDKNDIRFTKQQTYSTNESITPKFHH